MGDMEKQNFTIKLANKIIDISCIYETSKIFCRDYLSEQKADFKIKIFPEDIKAEKDNSDGNIYRDEYFEELALYRKICTELISHNILLFHSSAISVDNQAYIFTAKSGTGKSTHASLWRKYLGNKAVMINDDKPLIEIKQNEAIIYGTPWDGKHHLSNNIAVPIKAISILSQGKENEIHKVSTIEALPIMLQQTFMPGDAESTNKILGLLEPMLKNINIYKMSCNMDIEAAKMAYNTMSK